MRAHDDDTEAKTCAGFNVFHRPKKMAVIRPRARHDDYVLNHLKSLVWRNVPSQFRMLVFRSRSVSRVSRYPTRPDGISDKKIPTLLPEAVA